MSLRLSDLDLTALKRPFRSIWTYGSDWSSAQVLVRDNATTGHTVVPDEDRPDLKFEIQYRCPELAYFGVARREFAETPLSDFCDRIEETVRRGEAADSSLRSLLALRDRECRFSRAVYGVAHAWLENPRYTVTEENLDAVALAATLDEAAAVFSDGTCNPLMFEIVDPDLSVWIAFQVSSVRTGLHHLNHDLAGDLFSRILFSNLGTEP